MDTRTRMVKAAESLLRASTERDLSTRAVCEATGVGAPVLYRLFGDKNGLIAAVVDHAFARYLKQKGAQEPSDDPVDDLYTAWDTHVAFALANPTVYRIAYTPSLAEVPTGVEEARQLLIERFVRCAEAGKLNTTPDEAAQVMMAGCVGVNLCLLSQPATFNDPKLSARVRDATIGALLTDPHIPAVDQQAVTLKTVALQCAALIRATQTSLTGAEVTLLLQWLDTISANCAAAQNSSVNQAAPSSRAQRLQR
jgi:AcrR family transcriptional regulator